MKLLGALLIASLSALAFFVPAAQAYESDSQTVGYSDYGYASYARDYCFNYSYRVEGLYPKYSSGRVTGFAAICEVGTTPTRGSGTGGNGAPGAPQYIECPYGNYPVDGLRGYSDSTGVKSVGLSCNNGSYSTNQPTMAGTSGPYYNSVRCPSGNVAWGMWSSTTSTRLGRLGMICNGWWGP